MKRLIALFALLAASPALADNIFTKADYPEGPMFYKGRLYFSEVVHDRVMYSDTKITSPFWSMKGCGPAETVPYGADELLVLCYTGNSLVRVSAKGETVKTISSDNYWRGFVHPAAAVADDKGGIYIATAGEFRLMAPAAGTIMHLDGNGKLRRLADGLRYPNGIVFDAARKRLLVSEQFNHRILVYPFNEDGTLGERKLFADLTRLPGGALMPDPMQGPGAMAMDIDSGKLIVAEYGEGRLLMFAPDGSWLGFVKVPMRFPTGIALLPDGRALVTENMSYAVPPFEGDVMLADDILKRFSK